MKRNNKKITLKVFLLMTIYYMFSPFTQALVMSSDFVKCSEQQVLKHPFGKYTKFNIVVHNDVVAVADSCVTHSPLVSKLSIDKGVFEGIDYGEWGGIVRFLPNIPKDYIGISRNCPFCKSSIIKCNCPFSKLPVKENVLKGIFENVDSLEYGGMFMYIFLPPRDTSRIGILNENCRGFFKIKDKCFVITGSEHFGEGNGKICELVTTHNNCTTNKISNIIGYPKACISYENVVYIATKTSLLLFDGKGLKILTDFKSNFEPNSILCYDSCLFTAMGEGFVHKYDLNTKEVEWYKYVAA
ncbi:MAG: hypothetical protein Q4B84_04950 [Clostridia bacterium]|nr:hypothetical protein [Clostridia bacterium]